jgi:hypothetical protein
VYINPMPIPITLGSQVNVAHMQEGREGEGERKQKEERKKEGGNLTWQFF